MSAASSVAPRRRPACESDTKAAASRTSRDGVGRAAARRLDVGGLVGGAEPPQARGSHRAATGRRPRPGPPAAARSAPASEALQRIGAHVDAFVDRQPLAPRLGAPVLGNGEDVKAEADVTLVLALHEPIDDDDGALVVDGEVGGSRVRPRRLARRLAPYVAVGGRPRRRPRR